MFPSGFLGTRANILGDIVLIATLATPFLLMHSFRLARRRELEKHRLFQLVLLGVLLCAIVLFEVDVRMASSTGGLMKDSGWAGTTTLRALTIAHVLGAVLTFIGWLALTIASVKRFRVRLPGAFSRRHRTLGKAVFWGSVYTAVSAGAMYVMGFIL